MDDNTLSINYYFNMNGKNYNIYDSKNIDIIDNLKSSILSRIESLDNNLLDLRGNNLRKFINNTVYNLNNIIQALQKNDNNTSIDNIVLTTDIKMFIWLLKDILNFMKNNSYNFKKILEMYKNKLLNNNLINNNKRKLEVNNKSNKKRKLNNCSFVDDDNDDYYVLDNEEYDINDNNYHNDSIKFIEELFKGNTQSQIINDINTYLTKLNNTQKKQALTNFKNIKNYQSDVKPMIFRIMELPLDISQKNHIVKQYMNILKSKTPENKLNNWFETLMSVPFGKYNTISNVINPNKFLKSLNNKMDKAVYGHDEAKRQIVQIMGQYIKNPKCNGKVIGLYGVPGCGKTSLIKEGIAKALNRPFVFISLGGATDASFLEGHSYTYEGSIYGRIVNGLISSKCMDPIFYFDELDKISKTPKGDEIVNILIHLTDPIQSSHFRDKYLYGVDIDLSKAIFIFSFNDPSNVSPILLDRITMIETKFLLTSQKLFISKNYLLPELLKEMGLDKSSITIPDNIIEYLIETYTNEGGVRKLKELLYNIVREINLANIMKTDNIFIYPFILEKEHLVDLLKYKVEKIQDTIHSKPDVGVINGLFACSNGCGGILPIQVVWIPSEEPLKMKATGNLKKVIKESVDVATSVAWNYLDENLKNNYLFKFKKSPQGFHLHCPEGAIPKDGPSAGTALTVVLYSILTNKKIKNDIAITGEINLKGDVTQIGGLEEKLHGAKKAGIKLVLFPKDNIKNLDKIKERNPTLLDDNFKAISIDRIDEAISLALV
jgi:ATP-dependent Lon protease